MKPNMRSALTLLASLLIATIIGLGLAYLREETSRPQEPFAMPVAQAR